MGEKQEVEAIAVGAYETRFHKGTNSAVVVFRFSDREPLVFLIPIEAAVSLGTALVAMGEPGGPARPN